MNEHTVREIARVCYEANRGYCQATGDNSFVDWDEAPDWQVDTNIAGVRFAIEKYSETGQWPTPEQSHKSWMDQKASEGWRYGPVKNPETKEHPAFVAYNFLPQEQRVKDYIFMAIVKALAEAQNLV